MNKTVTRAVTLVMAFVMLLSVLPIPAFATIPNWEEHNVAFDGTSFGTTVTTM